MFDKILSFFFPNPCIICNKSVGRNKCVCDTCKTSIYYIGRHSICKTCGSPISSGERACGRCTLKPPPFDTLIGCTYFKGDVRTALHRFKFRNRPDLHSSFSAMLIQRLEELGCTDFDMVIPIPISKERMAERGYNQSALIAKDIATHFDALYNKEAISRKRHTERQSTLAHNYREANVRGAFSLRNAAGLDGKHVLLVDDIFSTGATMREAARVLSKTGCRITSAVISVSARNSAAPQSSE